ncbi:hypothetical protein [Archaeoglobus veneficus]|uniref:Uncharacterized protein n=1 Tax=Archaeoglobus veneficus (strain DSM 11195 / SNP6) TaxID=693661 RepID=F2KMS1_ARCVS|nr:hypothetical protein [Archaeoglobus veneficus]AEA46095.1 hypothetical protein Arcve_0052 [Archaeoglobus veneficus SNP6]
MFTQIAWLIKNLRGVLYFKEDQTIVDFVAKKFRYRNVGVPRWLAEEIGEKIEKKPFVKIDYPFEDVRQFVESLNPSPEVETIALASCYLCPVLTSARDYRELKPFAINEVYVGEIGDIGDKDLKLHLRIADYSVTDFYVWATTALYESVKHGKLEEHIKERAERIKKDKKRYWRVAKESGDTFIAYLDLSRLLSNISEMPEIAACAFGIVTAVILR